MENINYKRQNINYTWYNQFSNKNTLQQKRF